MIYARFLYIFPKIVGGLFRKLCFFSCLKLPIIKILPLTIGLPATYEIPTAHLRDDSTPKIVFFVPQKFPIIKIWALHQSQSGSSAGSARRLLFGPVLKRG